MSEMSTGKESIDAKYFRLFNRFATEAGLDEASAVLADAASQWCSLRELGVTDRRLLVAELAIFEAKTKRSDIINSAMLAAGEWAKTDAEPK